MTKNDLKKGNLLIIDDEELITESIEMIAKHHADKIFTANTGKDALEILKKEDIHCVICDISMPEMNGLQVIKSAREDGHKTPFIFYTAHGNEQLMMEVIKYNAFDFLDKPNLEGLLEVVTRGLQVGLGTNPPENNEESFMSDFQTLLKRLEK